MHRLEPEARVLRIPYERPIRVARLESDALGELRVGAAEPRRRSGRHTRPRLQSLGVQRLSASGLVLRERLVSEPGERVRRRRHSVVDRSLGRQVAQERAGEGVLLLHRESRGSGERLFE